MKYATLNIKNFWQFKSLFYAIHDRFSDFVFEFKESGVFGCGLDRSHITFMEFVLMPEYFVNYECFKPIKMQVDSEEFVNSIKRIKKGSKVTINIYDEMFSINVSRGQNLLAKASAEITDWEVPKKPPLELPEGITLKTENFENLIKDMTALGKYFNFIIGDNKLVLSENGIEGMLNGKTHEQERTSTCISLELLEPILKCKNFSKFINISSGNDTPLSITYKNQIPGGFVNFLIAPRITHEEDENVDECGNCPGEDEEVCDTCTGDD